MNGREKRVWITPCPIILWLFSITILSGNLNRVEAADKRYNIVLYHGNGANLASDVEYALHKLNISYTNIDEKDIIEDRIKEFSILIIPGGVTGIILSSIREGFEDIRNFVKRGGTYIGICAGAYLAAPVVNILGKPEGLGIINIENKRRQGLGIDLIRIVKEHSITKGYSGEIQIYHQNGPLMVAKEGVEILATYSQILTTYDYKDEFAAIVFSKYGKGKVIIFSPHPEGNLRQKIDPQEIGTLNLLKNVINFAKDSSFS